MTAPTRPSTLASFLVEQLDADETVARDAYYEGQRWIPEEEAVVAADRDLYPVMFLDRKSDAVHAARHDPARVLRWVAAARRIVELHDGWDGTWCSTCLDDMWPCPTLRALAAVYEGAPGWREEWA